MVTGHHPTNDPLNQPNPNYPQWADSWFCIRFDLQFFLCYLWAKY